MCRRGWENPLRLTFEVREAVAMDRDWGGEWTWKWKLKVEPSGVTVAWVLETFPRLTLVPWLILVECSKSRLPHPSLPLMSSLQPAVQLSGHLLHPLSTVMACHWRRVRHLDSNSGREYGTSVDKWEQYSRCTPEDKMIASIFWDKETRLSVPRH